jgi:K+-transporting ATPase KdpF subunit
MSGPASGWGAAPTRSAEVDAVTLIAGMVALAILAYLVFALLNPDRF